MNTAPEIYQAHHKHHELLGKQGSLVSFSKISAAPAGQTRSTPYYIGLIQLDDDETTHMFQLTNSLNDEPQIGMRMELVLRKQSEHGTGLIRYALKASPLP